MQSATTEVKVQADAPDRSNVNDIFRVRVRSSNGELLPLQAVLQKDGLGCKLDAKTRALAMIKVSALKALEGDADAAAGVLELMAAVDEYIPQPERALDLPFLMPIEDVFTITGRGTVVTGKIEQGKVLSVEEMELLRGDAERLREALQRETEMLEHLPDSQTAYKGMK